MVAVSRIIFIIICIFFIVFYFFILPLPKIIDKYEDLKQKQIILSYINNENRSFETIIAEMDKQNIDSLKYLLYQKNDNEIYIKFPESHVIIKEYQFKDKILLTLLYYIFGITIFSIILINFILSDEAMTYSFEKTKKRSKYYLGEN